MYKNVKKNKFRKTGTIGRHKKLFLLYKKYPEGFIKYLAKKAYDKFYKQHPKLLAGRGKVYEET